MSKAFKPEVIAVAQKSLENLNPNMKVEFKNRAIVKESRVRFCFEVHRVKTKSEASEKEVDRGPPPDSATTMSDEEKRYDLELERDVKKFNKQIRVLEAAILKKNQFARASPKAKLAPVPDSEGFTQVVRKKRVPTADVDTEDTQKLRSLRQKVDLAQRRRRDIASRHLRGDPDPVQQDVDFSNAGGKVVHE